MKGRKPKSTEQHKQDGTYQKVRHANRFEPEVLAKVPAPPKEWATKKKSKEMAEKWAAMCRRLLKANFLSDSYLDAVRAYIENHFVMIDSFSKLEKEGYVVKVGKVTRVNPTYKVYQEAAKFEKSMYDQFAGTPLAATRLKVEPPKEEKKDPLAALLSGELDKPKDKRPRA